MGFETSKAIRRRHLDPIWHRILRGHGIDIGCGPDPVDRLGLFPSIVECERFDREHGDAQQVDRPAESYDFVHSSHCLEDLERPAQALASWWRLVKPGGHLIVMVPDEDLYEQGVWPARFNLHHRWTFTLWKPSGASWSPRSINLWSLAVETLRDFRPILMRICDDGYDYSKHGVDQTAPHPGAEAAIEMVLQKR